MALDFGDNPYHITSRLGKGVTRIFHRGTNRTAEGQQRRWGSWGGATTPSPPAAGSGERCGLPQLGSWHSPDRPKVFHYFQHSVWPLVTL